MAVTGVDSILTAAGANAFQRITSSRIINTGATSVAGRWHEAFAISNGTGGIGVLTGTVGLGAPMTNADLGSMPIAPATVDPLKRYLMTFSAVTPVAVAAGGACRLFDLLYKYTSCIISTGAGSTLNNAAAKPTRLGTGEGVKAMCIVVGAIGATIPVITVSYTNQAGTAGRTGFFAASAVSQPVGSLITGAAVGSVLALPQMIMQGNDSGIRSIDSYTTATGTTGAVTFVLYRDLAEVPLVAANVVGERDFLSQFPPVPIIDDLACLVPFVNVGGALTVNAPINTTIQTVWL